MDQQTKLLKVSPCSNHIVLMKKDSEGKLMFHIALINGNFDTVRYLLAQFFPAFQNAHLKLESMSLIHLSLISAFTVPQD